MKDILKTIGTVGSMLLLIAVSVWFGWMFKKASLVARDSSPGYMQPSVELQVQYLESQGFDCGTPKDKAGPKFCQALNRWQCDQYAAQYFKPQIAQKPEAGK
jgi:hypothetical protein